MKLLATFIAITILAGTIPLSANADHRKDWRSHDDDDWRDHRYSREYRHDKHHWKHHHHHHNRGVVIIDNRYYEPSFVPVPVYNTPVYRSRVVCTTAYNPLPGILGGAAGGVIGSHIGKGSGRTAAIISGTLVGSMLTGQYGHPVRQCAEQVFETVPIGAPAVWNGPDNSYYSVTPTRDYRTDDRYCREYQSTAMVGGVKQRTYGTACQQPDGSWETAND